MSERESQVFKNQLTNKQFPPLNTPSKTIGGLEGRGNCPSESVKNRSHKNKTKFKRKKRRKISRDQLPLTKRDLLLLEKLDTFGLLSTQQIENHIFNNIDKSTVLRRLRILKKRGFLLASDGLPRGGLVWTLTKKGISRCMSLYGYIKAINRNSLQHDVLLSEILIHLQKRNIVEVWTPEHVLKRKSIGGGLYTWDWSHRDPHPLIPDGLFLTEYERKKRTVALEVEISQKTIKRYEKHFSFYRRRKDLWLIWYVVLNKSFGEKLLSLWRKEKSSRTRCGFSYSTVEEVMKEDFVLPEIMEEEGRIAKMERLEEE
ncbi:MAG: replication-relaxation family protein [Bdellovibrionales bacterium]|nr:replication-relaxation family protein [Bdellovibrionales bacterium]